MMRQSVRRILAAALAICTVSWSVPGMGAERAQQGPVAAAPGCPPLLARQLPRLQDEVPQDLCQYAGKVVLVVNTASFCGFTRQYEGLERLHARYRARGFVVLGFPSNDFGQQEPGSAKQIAEFCENTFGVRFPMFTKTRVSGPDADPLFAELSRLSGPPRWNFYKYLIGRDGKLIANYSSLTDPMDRKLIAEIERALTAPGT